MVMLSELRRFRLRDDQNAETPLIDLRLDLSTEQYPRATGIFFRRSLTQLAELPWDAVRSIDWRARRGLVGDLKSARDVDEHVLHRFTLRLWSWRDEFGTEEEWASVLSGLLKENLWETLT